MEQRSAFFTWCHFCSSCSSLCLRDRLNPFLQSFCWFPKKMVVSRNKSKSTCVSQNWSQKWENEKSWKPSKAEQIKLKPPSVFQLGFCDPGREEAIQQNCLPPTCPGRLCLHQPAFSRVVSLTTRHPLAALNIIWEGSSKWVWGGGGSEPDFVTFYLLFQSSASC